MSTNIVRKDKVTANCNADVAGKGSNTTDNVAQQSTRRVLDAYSNGRFYVGEVLAAHGGSYDVLVRGGMLAQAACIVAGHTIHYCLGTNDAFIPVEGSRVFIYMPNPASPYGIILGTLPSYDGAPPTRADGSIVHMSVEQLDPEGAANYATESTYRIPFEDPKYTTMINSHAGRPLDLFPGNRAWLNEQGLTLAILNLLLVMKATEKAKIELGVLDDTLRIVSGYFRHIHAQGEDQIYNDGGFITRIVTGGAYQCERSGFTDYGTKLTKENSNTEFIAEGTESAYNLVQPDVEGKKRFQMFAGHLGDILHYFVAKPDPAKNPDTMSADSKDQGLMHTHVDMSGRVIMRSAAGISFQRWDRIPVPKRKKEPWDPSGIKLDDTDGTDKLKEKKPFEMPQDHPYARSLVLRDMMAYYQKLAYQRIAEMADGTNEADYYLPEESDLSTPDDRYDPVGEGREKFSENALRQAYFNVEPDGSIILRDAWGSEIIMRGGNIIFNCAGQMELRSGRNIVQLAGHDIVAKARKSIDITATDRDVRIKANSNLHMLSEGREGPGTHGGGGILLESKSTNEGMSFTAKGEQAYSSGITLKAANARVFTQAKTVHMSGSGQVIMETFDNAGGNTGAIRISAGTLTSNTAHSTTISAGKQAALILQSHTALLVGNQAMLVGGNNVAILRGAKIWVPMTEADITTDFYQQIQPNISSINVLLQGTDWLKPFDPSTRVDIQFTYRSTAEYGTGRATEVQGATKFYVYQASWAYLANHGSTLVNVTVDKWKEYAVDDTRPWPGTDALADSYVVLEDEANIADKATGIPSARNDVKEKPGALTTKDFDEYEVVL